MIKRLNRTKNIISKQSVDGKQTSVVFNKSLIQNNDILKWVNNDTLGVLQTVDIKQNIEPSSFYTFSIDKKICDLINQAKTEEDWNNIQQILLYIETTILSLSEKSETDKNFEAFLQQEIINNYFEEDENFFSFMKATALHRDTIKNEIIPIDNSENNLNKNKFNPTQIKEDQWEDEIKKITNHKNYNSFVVKFEKEDLRNYIDGYDILYQTPSSSPKTNYSLTLLTNVWKEQVNIEGSRFYNLNYKSPNSQPLENASVINFSDFYIPLNRDENNWFWKWFEETNLVDEDILQEYNKNLGCLMENIKNGNFYDNQEYINIINENIQKLVEEENFWNSKMHRSLRFISEGNIVTEITKNVIGNVFHNMNNKFFICSNGNLNNSEDILKCFISIGENSNNMNCIDGVGLVLNFIELTIHLSNFKNQIVTTQLCRKFIENELVKQEILCDSSNKPTQTNKRRI